MPIFESSLGQQTPNIEPIQEVYSFEKDTNESMINENNYFINNDNFSESGKSLDVVDRLSTSSPLYSLEYRLSRFSFSKNCNATRDGNGTNAKFDLVSTYDESCSLNKIRKNIFTVRSGISGIGTTGNANKSENAIHLGFQLKSCKKEKGENVEKSESGNYHNLSCNLTMTSNEKNDLSGKNDKKRGRKKCFPDGIKREIIDKAFLRQFKLYLRDSKILKNYKLDPEEKTFWTEFSQNNNPPLRFTINNQKAEFRSFSTNLMKFIFSHNSVRNLYDQFAKETHLIKNLLDKKIKNVSDKVKTYYCIYGSNMHKMYSIENSVYSADLLDIMNNVNHNNLSIINNSNTNTQMIAGSNEFEMFN